VIAAVTWTKALGALASTTSAASAIVLFLMGSWLARSIDQWPNEIRGAGEILTVAADAAGLLGMIILMIKSIARRR
jgi:membrane protein DedA with SNARE-associated domain